MRLSHDVLKQSRTVSLDTIVHTVCSKRLMVTGLTPRSSAEHVGVAMYPVITY